MAQTYGKLRAQLENKGTPLAALDLQIAAHALHVNAVLVRADSALKKLSVLTTEDWVYA